VPTLIPIDDPADPRLEPYRDIRERDLVGRQGRFIAEGETVLRVLAGQHRHRPLSVLIAAKRLEKLRPILDTLAEGVPVYLASQPVLDGIVGFELHRGILALAERAPAVFADDLLASLPANALVMALVGIANHDNMGGLFRNAASEQARSCSIRPAATRCIARPSAFRWAACCACPVRGWARART